MEFTTSARPPIIVRFSRICSKSYSATEDPRLREGLGATLARMAAATADLTHPDGGVALFNDAGLHMAHPPGACLAAYRGMSGAAVAHRDRIRLEDAGFFGVRTDDFYVLADCGPIAPDFLVAHGHGDILSFEWSAGGKRIIVDPGVFEYASGPRRCVFPKHPRATTPSRSPMPSRPSSSAPSVAAGGPRAEVLACEPTANGGLVLEGTHDGFDHLPGRPRHVRRFVMSPAAGSIEIVDRIEGDGHQAAIARLLLHPACTL